MLSESNDQIWLLLKKSFFVCTDASVSLGYCFNGPGYPSTIDQDQDERPRTSIPNGKRLRISDGTLIYQLTRNVFVLTSAYKLFGLL